MAISALEGVVEHGRIRLREDVSLPENTRVYVVVPDVPQPIANVARILSPRLVHREQAALFKKQVLEVR